MKSNSSLIFRFLYNNKKLNLCELFQCQDIDRDCDSASGECKTERTKSNSAIQTGKFQRQTLCVKEDIQ